MATQTPAPKSIEKLEIEIQENLDRAAELRKQVEEIQAKRLKAAKEKKAPYLFVPSEYCVVSYPDKEEVDPFYSNPLSLDEDGEYSRRSIIDQAPHRIPITKSEYKRVREAYQLIAHGR